MSSQQSTHWSDEEVRFLISMWREDEVFGETSSSAVRNKTVYKQMQKRMADAGFVRSADQIKNKIKALKSKYKSVVDNNMRSGRGRITCPYYDILNEFLGHRPAVNPPALLQAGSASGSCGAASTSSASGSSSNSSNKSNVSSSTSDDEVDSDDESEAAEGDTAQPERDDARANNSQESLDDFDMVSDNEQLNDDIDHGQEHPNQEGGQDTLPDQDRPRAVQRENRSARKRDSLTRRDRTIKEALEKLTTVTRQRDRAFMDEERAYRQEEAHLRREEMALLREQMELDRERMQMEREQMRRDAEERRRDREMEERRRDEQFRMMMATLQNQTPNYYFPPNSQLDRSYTSL